jgi:cysteine desulfurase
VSTGSACTTGSVEPSHVLLALGIDEERAAGSLRLTLGRETTRDEVTQALRVIERCINRLRDASATVRDAQPATLSGAPSA